MRRHSLQITGDDLIPDPPLRTLRSLCCKASAEFGVRQKAYRRISQLSKKNSSFLSAVTGVVLVLMCGGTRAVAFSMAPKAVTTPIAINIAQAAGGIASLSAASAISGGILVAISINWIFRLAGITDVRTYGFAAGTAGSGIGAAHALSFCELAGAFGALAVGFNGLITPLIVLALAHIWPV